MLLLGSALLGTLLLVLVFCLPVNRMELHVAESVDAMMRDPGQFPEDSFSYYLWSERESYTDAIMVQNAIEKIPEKNAFEHAMWVYHRDLEEEYWAPEESLKAYCEGVDKNSLYLHEYSRYWHGYLIYLKPLLLLLNWRQLTIFGVVFQILLMLIAAGVAVWKKQAGVAIAMVIGFLFMKPTLVLVSLTMTVCWVITLISLIVMMLRNEKLLEKNWYPEYFLMVGILTSYFDFLTYPVVTLGFPLCAFFLMNNDVIQNNVIHNMAAGGGRIRETLKGMFGRIAGYSVCWGLGYAGMWAMKWVIADVTLHTGTIKDALWSVIGRTEAIGGRSRFNGGFYVIGLNLQEYDRAMYPVMAAVLALVSLALIVIACRRKGTQTVLTGLVPYAAAFCIPFVWIIAVQHHSALHARFTFRILALAALAVGCMGIWAWKEMRRSPDADGSAIAHGSRE